MNRDRLLQWLAEPLGEDRLGKVACFLQGGRFGGDRASIIAPAPALLAVFACDCSPAGLHEPCGQATHWADVALADELGDVPRHAAYYVLVHTHPALSGVTAALYVSAGHERPSRAAMTRAQDDFERAMRTRAERAGVRLPTTQRGTA